MDELADCLLNNLGDAVQRTMEASVVDAVNCIPMEIYLKIKQKNV
jgi:hypothetical protein